MGCVLLSLSGVLVDLVLRSWGVKMEISSVMKRFVEFCSCALWIWDESRFREARIRSCYCREFYFIF